MSCIVRGCRSHSGNKNSGENISFHKFPKTEDIRRRWFAVTDRSEKQHKHHWRLCSKHFSPECFVGGNLLRPRLKENAVPTLNLSSKTEFVLGLPIMGNSSEQQRSTSGLATNDMTCPFINHSQQQISTNISVSHNMPLATTSMSLADTMTVSQTTLKAIYEGRINKLQNRIQKLELIAKSRLLKLNAQKQRTRRLKINNSIIKQRLTELLNREKLDEE